MSIRFSTVAANADVLGEDTPAADAPDALSSDVGADGTPRDPNDRASPAGGRPAAPESGDAKPGKDINAPGFVKDKDAGKPS